MLHRTCVLIVLLTVLIPVVCRGTPLTADEQDYLSKLGKVTVCVDPDWVPFERINEHGVHEGIAADLLNLISARTGIQFELVKTKSWDESLQASQDGRCMALSFLNQTPERDKWLLFTTPLFDDPNVFITREEHPFIADPAYFSQETIIFPVGTAMEELIRDKYPNLRVVSVPTENEALQMVSEKKADMTMRSLIVAAYTIKKEGLFNLKIAGQFPDFTNHLRIGVVNDQPMLRDILDKGIRTITSQEKWEIVNKHVSINAQTTVDYTLLFYVIGGFSIVIAAGAYWTMKLNRLTKELARVSQTDMLTGIANRMRLDAQLCAEMERSSRSRRPFSVILIDIDNFKKVNDEFGHLAGDQVIKSVALIIKENVRISDSVGRWGGEEFLIICPETVADDSRVIADRIREAVQAFPFCTGLSHTISAGIAMCEARDTVDSLLHRADTALYQAKRVGRNRVCML